VGELATGVAHDINNPLAIITASSGVVRDMVDPEFDLDGIPENIRKELDKNEGGNISNQKFKGVKINGDFQIT
jgi:hypothetical protein